MGCTKIHIGHHFFGAGNIGDDLMMAGFLTQVEQYPAKMSLTCAIPHPLASQQIRFPQVQWSAYNKPERERCIRECDVWLGLGDTPFQIDLGPWLLDHLVEEMELCKRHEKPMYFLGVGVNDVPAVHTRQAHDILDYATHVWTRDAMSAELLGNVAGGNKVTTGADLAHLWLRKQVKRSLESKVLGYILNFEQAGMFSSEALAQLLKILPQWEHRWLVQEVRKLPGSERMLYEQLPQGLSRQLVLQVPNYEQASLEQLLTCGGNPQVLVSSRYHALLAGAWRGCKVVPVLRSDKLQGLCLQIGVRGLTRFGDGAEIAEAIAQAQVVSDARLNQLGDLAEQSCLRFFDAASITSWILRKMKQMCFQGIGQLGITRGVWTVDVR